MRLADRRQDRRRLPLLLLLSLAPWPAAAVERVSVVSGAWSAPATWGGQVPLEGDSVEIAAGTDVVFDLPDLRLHGLHVRRGGTLRYDAAHGGTLESDANVVVEGGLVMRPENPSVEHILRFVDVDESAFVGGGMVPLASDVGLWVMGPGRLDLVGSPRSGWLRLDGGIAAGATSATLEAAPVGWQVGDAISIAPTESPTVGAASVDGFDEATVTGVDGNTIRWDLATAHAHPMVDARWTAEVIDLTRNVRIEGTPAGRAHVFVHAWRPQTIAYVQVRYMGPRRAGDDATEPVLGRYGLHFHHSQDGSRGSQVIGTVVRDGGSHAFVPHLSHGITFHDTVAYSTVDEAYWWDLAAPDERGDETHDTVYDHAIAARILAEPSYRGFRLNGFTLAQGLRNVVRDSVAVGVQGNVDASGFDWPESSGASQEHGVWDFSRGNVAHNNARHGLFVWQNDDEPHVLADFAAYHNGGAGLAHGAYGNAYHYLDARLYGNAEGALRLQAVSAEGGAARFDDVVFDGAGIVDYLIQSDDHTFDGTQGPTVFRAATLRGARVAAVRIGSSANVNPDALDFEYPLLQVPADVSFSTDAPPGNVVRIDDGESAVRITREGREPIAPFAAPAADHSLPQASLLVPLGGAAIAGATAFDAHAYDDTGIARLDLYVDNVWRARADSAPYRFTLATAPLGAGYRLFQLAATDLAGNVNWSNLVSYRIDDGGAPQPPEPPAADTAAPVVRLLTPAKNDVLGGVAVLTADAHDDFGVSRVEFRASGALIGTDASQPYRLDWDTQTIANGRYDISAVAYDYSGHEAEDVVIDVDVANALDHDHIFANGWE
ncbi:MAG TPA: Ig-like domain-containing protein [Dokdonella sp.]|nr:Ig-like domain-containing protein [Dokdonella sp.]